MYPADDILLARGKYSTLGKERREQLQRVQVVVNAIVTDAHQVLRDCHSRPPVNEEPLTSLPKLFENLGKARERIVSITTEMNDLENLAWGNNKQQEVE